MTLTSYHVKRCHIAVPTPAARRARCAVASSSHHEPNQDHDDPQRQQEAHAAQHHHREADKRRFDHLQYVVDALLHSVNIIIQKACRPC